MIRIKSEKQTSNKTTGKWSRPLAGLLVGAFLLTGCGEGANTHGTASQNIVDDAIDSQIAAEKGKTEADTAQATEAVTEAVTQAVTEPVTEAVTEPVTEAVTEASTEPETTYTSPAANDRYDPFEGVDPTPIKEPDPNVDVDLTSMNQDMVYATVLQMVNVGEEYEGKKVKMEGAYYSSYYEPTGQYYHYVIIRDALACCAQGLEFVWDDGSHVYPDEYPEDGSEVEVVGEFEIYQEEGDPSYYIHLKDSTMKVLAAAEEQNNANIIQY